MSRLFTPLGGLSRIARACVTSVLVASSAGCYGEEFEAEPVSYPSSALIATEMPVYYDGEATYFNDGVWYYQRGGRWQYYHSEPGYLRNFRATHAGSFGRGGGGRGRGGGRAGGHGGRR